MWVSTQTTIVVNSACEMGRSHVCDYE